MNKIIISLIILLTSIIASKSFTADTKSPASLKQIAMSKITENFLNFPTDSLEMLVEDLKFPKDCVETKILRSNLYMVMNYIKTKSTLIGHITIQPLVMNNSINAIIKFDGRPKLLAKDFFNSNYCVFGEDNMCYVVSPYSA